MDQVVKMTGWRKKQIANKQRSRYMTKDEALKLALEALEEFNFPPHHRSHKAITAIKEVLAQPEQEPRAWINWSALTGEPRLGWECESELASEPLYTTPPQPKEPEQEPVAYLDEGLGAFYFAKQYKKNVGFTPLYTTPPQRKPLTRERLLEIADAQCGAQRTFEDWVELFGRCIEAAHGIKEKNT